MKALQKLHVSLAAKPLEKPSRASKLYNIATSTKLKIAVAVLLVVQTGAGLSDYLMVINGYDHHVIYLIVSILFTMIFIAEFIIKVRLSLHHEPNTLRG